MSRALPRILNNLAMLLALGVMLLGASMGRADTLDDVKREVEGSMRYRYSTKREQPNIYATEANCYGFASRYQGTAMARGVYGQVRACNLTTGEGHAFFIAEDGRVLDVRHKSVVTLAEVGCK